MKPIYAITALLAAVAIYGSGYFYTYKPAFVVPESPVPANEPSLAFIALGDYGWDDTLPQHVIADFMNTIAEQRNAQFVLGLGDNFYDPSGVSGVDDPAWDTHWRLIFQTKSFLKNLPWYGTIGNHDYNNTGLLSEFEYNKSGWKIGGPFWTHTHSIGGQEQLAIVHVDTSYLAYGPVGEYPLMQDWFEYFNYTSNEDILQLAREQLEAVQDYKWILTAGHHQIGGDCSSIMNTGLLLDVFQDFNVTAYIHGHVHSIEWRYADSIAYVCSGAGGSLAPVCEFGGEDYPQWARGDVYGFALITVTENLFYTEFFYTRDMLTWESTRIQGIPPNLHTVTRR